MIIAIFGASATGKTTLAAHLASRLCLPVRHCGIELRTAAAAKGFLPSDAPDTVHHEVDAATIEWCIANAQPGGIVEGRFLDHVLYRFQDQFLVRIYAKPEERVTRWSQRLDRSFGDIELKELDDADACFRQRMYATKGRRSEDVAVDTTSGLVEEWADVIETHTKRHLSQRPG